MGLDAVEIVLRAEELYAITIPNDEAASVRTVGDFYHLLCTRLDLTPLPSPITPTHLPRRVAHPWVPHPHDGLIVVRVGWHNLHPAKN